MYAENGVTPPVCISIPIQSSDTICPPPKALLSVNFSRDGKMALAGAAIVGKSPLGIDNCAKFRYSPPLYACVRNL